ncbi:MAG: Uma2 family endonuclease [Lewinellaceae bacterium]|nr:Uma2 family endonuclease [Saprospiraceae bacterium]MCB9341672.1 Uma2 family endonuclease [Lewinellaceae bacterium]
MSGDISSAQAPLKLKRKDRFVTLREYVLWEAKHDEKYEYHNGKIVKMPYARGPHNEITINVVAALKNAVRPLKKKYRIFSGDQKIYLPEVNHGVYPDAVAVSEVPEYWDDDTLLLVNPLLVVEVLSRSTQKYDREGKFDLYKARPSFEEYILVRQDTCEVETRFREEPGLWRETVVTDPNGTVFLKSIGCVISMADIYEHIEFPKPAAKK